MEEEIGLNYGEYDADLKEVSPNTEPGSFMKPNTTIIDMTAEDILEKNPRYLNCSKNFDTFISIGPHVITPDAVVIREIAM